LLFEAHDIPGYIQLVKHEIDSQFESINTVSVYFVKKSLRKIVRITSKYIRYSGSAIVEAELLIYFCQRVNDMDAAVKKNTVIANMYSSQIKKITAAIEGMHEDLQYDYLRTAETLQQ
jgi:hypothetical protein